MIPPPSPTGGPKQVTLGLGTQAARGAAWLTAQTLLSKFVSMVGQVALATLLLREDFGLFALALTVTAFARLISQAGLREILVLRGKRFDRWGGMGVWFAGMLGVVEMFIILAAAPLAAWAYDTDRVVPLMMVLSLTGPLNGLSLVPDVGLSVHMRFRAIATLGWVMGVLQVSLSVLLAWWGMGPMSFALPLPIVAAVKLVVLWAIAPPPLTRRPQLRRWRYLVSDSVLIFAGNLLISLRNQGDYILLGAFHSPSVVGIYFFAFNLTTQTVQLFSQSLAAVLMPTLTKMRDHPVRQVEAYVRALRLLAVVLACPCMMLSATSGSVVALLFPSRWEAAVPVLRVLAVATFFNAAGSSAGALINAQGRFRLKLLTNIFYSVLFVVMVLAAAAFGGALSVAVAVAVVHVVTGLLHPYLAIRHWKLGWRSVLNAYAMPVVFAAVAYGVPVGVMDFLGRRSGDSIMPLLRFLVIAGTGTITYLLLIRFLLRDQWRELFERLGSLVRRN